MCYVVFGVVCLVCSGAGFCLMSQNKEEIVECGADGRAEGGLILRHCLHLNVNSHM